MSITQRYQAKMKAIDDAKRLHGLTNQGQPQVIKEIKSFETVGTTYQTLAFYQAGLDEDLTRLKALNTEQKIALKTKELIPRYLPIVNEFLASDRQAETPLCGWVLIWLSDCAEFEEAFNLAKQLLARGQELPVKREIPVFMADAIKEWATNELAQGNAINPYVSDLLTLVENDPAWAIHDKSRAELYKLLGLQAFAKEDWQEAVDKFTTAQALDKDVGVKTRLATAEKALAKQEQAGASA